MVSLNGNPYEIREYLYIKALENAKGNPFKHAFLEYLGILNFTPPSIPINDLYLRCAVSGISNNPHVKNNFSRLFGQAHMIDGVPLPWANDIWAIFCIKLAVSQMNDVDIATKFESWINDFLPQRICSGQLTNYDVSLAEFINSSNLKSDTNPCIKLFLHYKNILPITNSQNKKKDIESFLEIYKEAYKLDITFFVRSIIIYIFDKVNAEQAAVPVNKWEIQDILNFLNNISVGLKKWTWEEKKKTKNSSVVKWQIENEYHVQNLIFLLLGPIFPDIEAEVYTAQLGQINPRIDVTIPSINTIIEIKYRKDKKKSFAKIIEEVAADASLYKADPKFENSKLVIFLFDHTRATEEHDTFKRAVERLKGIDGCVVICSPSFML